MRLLEFCTKCAKCLCLISLFEIAFFIPNQVFYLASASFRAEIPTVSSLKSPFGLLNMKLRAHFIGAQLCYLMYRSWPPVFIFLSSRAVSCKKKSALAARGLVIHSTDRYTDSKDLSFFSSNLYIHFFLAAIHYFRYALLSLLFFPSPDRVLWNFFFMFPKNTRSRLLR